MILRTHRDFIRRRGLVAVHMLDRGGDPHGRVPVTMHERERWLVAHFQEPQNALDGPMREKTWRAMFIGHEIVVQQRVLAEQREYRH